MKCSTVALIKTPRLPRPRNRHFTRILAKQCTGNMQSTSPSSSKKNDGSSKPTSPTSTNQPRGDGMAELSDVQCYTCRRRHVKCDRQLPTCAKCAKKGVPCLGYQKPLRWAEGVAVRGKLKGKSRPVVDSNVVRAVQNTMELASPTGLEDVGRTGLPIGNFSTDVARNDATLYELMNYHNSTMCAEHVTFEESKFITRSIAPLTMDVIEKLPRDIVNCILGIAAVHMASRHPGNRPLERLALETKASVFHSFNNRLQSPHNQHPDVIVCCGILIFAMDLFEQGMARWMLHFLGSMNVMSSFGGMENLFTYYPHLQLPLTHVAHFETLWVILSHIPLTRPKQASRRALELLCASPDVKRRFYNPCPTILTLAVWDMGACASKLLCDPMESISNADLHMRDRIIRDILAYRPEEGAMDIKESYYKDIAFPEARLKAWNAISAAWKGAITILALRYLYFGRANLNPQAHGQHPSTPPINASTELWYTPYDEPRPYYHQSAAVPEAFSEPDGLPEYLSAGLDINDPLSRSPSPLPFLYLDPPASDIWDKRYEIHDEAFSALYSNLFSIHDNLPPVCLRYIVLPIIILALVSRPGSSERTLCLSYFGKFKDFMETNYPPDSPIDAPRSREQTQSPSPQGGENLEFDIPWDRLDAYSEVVERQKQESIHSDDGVLTKGAPEWNWWDMLRNSQLSMIWPVTCGTSHFERGSEFWAFKLISAVVNDETFTTWTSGQATPQPSSSSSYF